MAEYTADGFALAPDPATVWTWEKSIFDLDGTTYVEYKGECAYYRASITNFPDRDFFRPTMRTWPYEQRGPYYKTAASAKKWCERYGKTRNTA